MNAAEAFLEAAGPVDDPKAVAREVTTLCDRGRQAHPSLELEDATFGRYLAERVATDEPLLDALARLRGADLFLACACAQGDPRAIAAFDQAILAPAMATLVRRGEPKDLVDEGAQLVRARLFLVDRQITGFSGRGSLAGWVRVSVGRQVIDLKRAQPNHVPIEEDTAQELAEIDPELALLRRRYGPAFRAAFHDAFAKLSSEQRTALTLHFIDGLNLEGMARMLRVSRATAGRRVLDAKAELLEAFLSLLGERLNAPPSEIESLLKIVRSTLYGSLPRLLRAAE